MSGESEVFGSDAQKRMLQKGHEIWELLSHDPRYCCHGRGVQVARDCENAIGLVTSLARLHGVSACECVARENSDDFVAGLKGRGLSTEVFCSFEGGQEAVEISRNWLSGNPLASDLSVHIIGPESPSGLVAAYAEVALAQGVLPADGAVLRGLYRQAFGMVAMESSSGKPIATASAVLNHPDNSKDKDSAQWGQLATIPERQGQKIAKTLGAHSLVYGWDKMGMRYFKAGVKADNISSTRLCNGLGIEDRGNDIVVAIDVSSFESDSMTA